MNKIIYIFLFFIFLTGLLYSDELSNYSIIKIKDIPSGKEEGMIGWQPAIAGGKSGPSCFAISKKNIYIPDRVNYRINVYDLDSVFIRSIVEQKDKKAHFSNSLKIDEKGNIIYLSSRTGLRKIDNNGNIVYSLDKNLPRKVHQYKSFFPLNDEIFIYNDQGEVESISNSGKIEAVCKAKARLQEITNTEDKLQNTISRAIKIPDEKKQIIDILGNSSKHLMVGDNFYSANFRDNKEFFDKVKELREFVRLEKVKNRGIEEKKEININLDKYSMKFIGYDKEHNSYWKGIQDKVKDAKNYAVIIYTKYGELLDAFYYGQHYKNKPNLELYSTSGALVAVSPAGNVYFLVGNKKQYTLYKVERQW